MAVVPSLHPPHYFQNKKSHQTEEDKGVIWTGTGEHLGVAGRRKKIVICLNTGQVHSFFKT